MQILWPHFRPTELEILDPTICGLTSPLGDSDARLFKNNYLRLVLLSVLLIPPNITFSEGWRNGNKLCPPATTSSNTWLFQQPPNSSLYFSFVLLQSIPHPAAKVNLLGHKFVSVSLFLKTCQVFPSPFTYYPIFQLSYRSFKFWCRSPHLQPVQSIFLNFNTSGILKFFLCLSCHIFPSLWSFMDVDSSSWNTLPTVSSG